MNRIKDLRQEMKLSMKETAAKLGIPYTTYVNYEKGYREPNSETLIKLSEFFGVTIDYLIGNVTEPYFYLDNKRILDDINSPPPPDNIMPMPQTYKVPRLGVIACGEPILAEQNIECYDAVPDYIKCDFTLVCKGDSMINARIFDGDIVCIKQQPIVESGEIAAVLVGDEEATLKRVYIYDDKIILQPENPSYPPFVYVGDEMNNVRILGKATHFISAVR